MRNFHNLVDLARRLKENYQTGRAFHVAFAIKGGKVIEIGINSYQKNNCISSTYKSRFDNNKVYRAGIHAEMDVTGKLKFYDTKRITIVVIRIDNNGNLANSKPCPNCAYQLGLLNYKNVYFSNSEGQFEKLK